MKPFNIPRTPVAHDFITYGDELSNQEFSDSQPWSTTAPRTPSTSANGTGIRASTLNCQLNGNDRMLKFAFLGDP